MITGTSNVAVRICPTCAKAGQSSTVYADGGSTTLLATRDYWDEAGNFHHHDCNRVTKGFHCSNGHRWTETETGAPCPTCGDEWKFKPDPMCKVSKVHSGVLRRNTGRTRRMLRDAMKLCEAGRAVYVIAADSAHADTLKHSLYEIRREVHCDSPDPGYNSIKIETPDTLNFDWRIMAVPHAHPKCVFLVDHYAIERWFGPLFDMLHRYDDVEHDAPADTLSDDGIHPKQSLQTTGNLACASFNGVMVNVGNWVRVRFASGPLKGDCIGAEVSEIVGQPDGSVMGKLDLKDQGVWWFGPNDSVEEVHEK